MFKKCGLCALEWGTCEAFLNDRDNRFEGYVYLKDRALDGMPVEGLLLFTHRRAQCGTTLAIAASRFRRSGACPEMEPEDLNFERNKEEVRSVVRRRKVKI
ncbi:MAG: hypothetical protein WB699_11690 [Bacteroidota bacterium]